MMSIDKMVFVGPARLRTVSYIGANLRPEDRRELETVAPDHTAEAELLRAVTASEEVWVASVGTEPIAVFGIGRAGVIWMVGTAGISKAPIQVFRTAQGFVRCWLRQYGHLHNAADCRNTLHLRWLKLLGFTFDDVIQINGQPFQRFHMTREEGPNV
jgi:hypothetical protein